jgi:hypothetical protein
MRYLDWVVFIVVVLIVAFIALTGKQMSLIWLGIGVGMLIQGAARRSGILIGLSVLALIAAWATWR